VIERLLEALARAIASSNRAVSDGQPAAKDQQHERDHPAAFRRAGLGFESRRVGMSFRLSKKTLFVKQGLPL
jgi:hypothetical protein